MEAIVADLDTRRSRLHVAIQNWEHDFNIGSVEWLDEHGITPVGVDNLPGSVPLETARLPQDCCLLFGSEGSGLTDEVVAGCDQLVAITQYGSTRSMNAGAAAAIAMYAWTTQWCEAPNLPTD